MRVLRDHEVSQLSREPTIVTVGVFDGVHRGHQALLRRVVSDARRREVLAGVVTFDPHPAQVLSPMRAPKLLQGLDQRLEGFEREGIDVARVVEFNQARAQQSASDFISHVLVEEMFTCEVVVGKDFHFGHDRGGDVTLLAQSGRDAGFTVTAFEPVGEPVFSSTRAREAVAEGDLVRAREVLGRPWSLRASVAHGDHRGTAMGFATANLNVTSSLLLPAKGIYAGRTLYDGREYAVALSVGTRPHFYDDGELLVEAHIVGFSGDLYEKVVEVEFFERLRDEMVFSSDEALIVQIAQDVTRCEEIFRRERE